LTTTTSKENTQQPLFIHLSKTPSTTSITSKFISTLQNFGINKKKINLVTKKINLGADKLVWEHEIYNIRRIHSLTLSNFEKFDDAERWGENIFLLIFLCFIVVKFVYEAKIKFLVL